MEIELTILRAMKNHSIPVRGFQQVRTGLQKARTNYRYCHSAKLRLNSSRNWRAFLKRCRITVRPCRNIAPLPQIRARARTQVYEYSTCRRSGPLALGLPTNPLLPTLL